MNIFIPKGQLWAMEVDPDSAMEEFKDIVKTEVEEGEYEQVKKENNLALEREKLGKKAIPTEKNEMTNRI